MLCSQFSHANSSCRLFLSWNMCTYFWPVPSVQSNKTNTALQHLGSLDSKVLVWNTAQKEALCEKAGQEEKGRFLQLVPKFTATLIGQKNDSWKHHLPRTIKCPLESSSLLLYGMTNLTMWAKTESQTTHWRTFGIHATRAETCRCNTLQLQYCQEKKEINLA